MGFRGQVMVNPLLLSFSAKSGSRSLNVFFGGTVVCKLTWKGDAMLIYAVLSTGY